MDQSFLPGPWLSNCPLFWSPQWAWRQTQSIVQGRFGRYTYWCLPCWCQQPRAQLCFCSSPLVLNITPHISVQRWFLFISDFYFSWFRVRVNPASLFMFNETVYSPQIELFYIPESTAASLVSPVWLSRNPHPSHPTEPIKGQHSCQVRYFHRNRHLTRCSGSRSMCEHRGHREDFSHLQSKISASGSDTFCGWHLIKILKAGIGGFTASSYWHCGPLKFTHEEV